MVQLSGEKKPSVVPKLFGFLPTSNEYKIFQVKNYA